MIIHCFDCVLLGFVLSFVLVLLCGGLCYFFYRKGESNGFDRYYRNYREAKDDLKSLVHDIKELRDDEFRKRKNS